MVTLLLLIFIIVVLAIVLFNYPVPQRLVNILLLIIAGLVLLHTASWRITL